MDEAIALTADELQVLRMALAGPVCDPDPAVRRLCINLQARQLLQRAGVLSLANGWRGPPQAFVLSREGWNRLKAERRPGSHRLTG